MGKITKTYTVERKGDWIVASTPAPDRDKDRVMPQGINTDNFQKNPALFYGHNYQDPWALIGKVAEWKIDGNAMTFRPELREPVNEADPMTVIKSLWDSGLLKASSIGFIPRKAIKNELGGMDFSEVELLEISLTPLPANQEALRLAMKALKTQAIVKSPDYRLPDETVDACNARKFQELMDADPSLSEADARAEAARICSQDAPPADKPADAPADAPPPPPDKPAKDAGGDMAQYVAELAAHLTEALSICQELMNANAPADQPAPQDAPPPDPAQNSKAVTKRGRVLSAGNEGKLRTAHSNIGEVLAQLGDDAPEQASAGKDADAEELILKELAAVLGDLPKVFSK